MEVKRKKSEPFEPKNPHFQNHDSKQKMKASFAKGRSDVRNINHWFEGKGKQYQSGKYSQEEIQSTYEMYLNDLMC